jgi:hypothetical protein
MQRWMKKCLSDKTLMKSRREKLLEKMKTIKESIRSIKNNQIIPNKKKYIEESESIEKKTSDYKTQIDTQLSTILSIFKEKRISTINFLKNDSNTPSPTSNLRPENFLSIESDLANALKAILGINDEIYSYNLYLFDLRMEMEKSVKETMGLVSKELDGMEILQGEISGELLESIKKMNNDFTYLHSPSLLPSAYNASLEEVSRRRSFEKKLEEVLGRFNGVIKRENLKRKKFLGKYGGILPHNFIPGLKVMLEEVGMELEYEGLPLIEGGHNELEVTQEFDFGRLFRDSWAGGAGTQLMSNFEEKTENFGKDKSEVMGGPTTEHLALKKESSNSTWDKACTPNGVAGLGLKD